MKLGLLLMALIGCQTFSNAQSAADALRKGNAYYKRQQYTLAEEQYKTVLEKTPGDVTALHNLSATLYQQKKWGEAHGLLKKLTDVTDRNVAATAQYNNGVVYTREKALEQSIEAYKAALRLNPGDTQARENLQKALLEKKKQQEQQKEQQKKQQKSNMSQKEAEQRLKLLQEREKQLQQRFQQGGQKGQSMPKDW